MFKIFGIFEYVANIIVYQLFGLDPASSTANNLHFFVLNVFKVFAVILGVGFFIGIIKTYITPEKTRDLLKGKKGLYGHFMATFLAVITPVESFSVIPVFIGFLEAGIPTSLAFSYLITAPLTNEYAFALFWAILGPEYAIMYYVIGILLGMFTGMVIGILKLEKYVEPIIFEKRKKYYETVHQSGLKDRIDIAKSSSISFFKNIWIYILIGVGAAAVIRGYVPDNQIIKYVGNDNWFAVPIAVLLVLFLYLNIATVLPVLIIFIGNNLPLGTLFAFTMAVTATSIPELLVLKRTLKLPLLLIYALVLFSAIITVGYLLNYIST